jgi:hypothetical protein
MLHENEEAPCDIVILSCSSETGIVYLQTTNIDGESDYKRRSFFFNVFIFFYRFIPPDFTIKDPVDLRSQLLHILVEVVF